MESVALWLLILAVSSIRHIHIEWELTNAGYVMNWEYRRVASSLGFSIDRTRGDDLLEFPIEKARLRATYFYMGAAAVTTIRYGWALDVHTHFAIPLVLQFFIGASITGVFNACGTLLVDVNPTRPATASAAANLFRCLLACRRSSSSLRYYHLKARNWMDFHIVDRSYFISSAHDFFTTTR